MFPPRISHIAHRGRVQVQEPDVLKMVPPTADIVHLDRVWRLDPDTSPLVMLELWRPTDEDEELFRRFLLDFGRRVLATAMRPTPSRRGRR